MFNTIKKMLKSKTREQQPDVFFVCPEGSAPWEYLVVVKKGLEELERLPEEGVKNARA